MLPCTLSSSVINEDAQYYLFGDMGPDIISIIENDLGHEVDENGTMCANCFANIMHKMAAPARSDTVTTHMEMSSTIHEEFELQPSLDMNVCVWCRSSLYMRHTHALPEGPERHLIAERISPQDIPLGSLVCYSCWVRAISILQQQNASDSSSSRIHLNTCVRCLCSLNQTRRHSIPEGPERNMIISQATSSQQDLFLIRGCIKSRHHSGRTYYTYILMARQCTSWDEKIMSYYCNCISGHWTAICRMLCGYNDHCLVFGLGSASRDNCSTSFISGWHITKRRRRIVKKK